MLGLNERIKPVSDCISVGHLIHYKDVVYKSYDISVEKRSEIIESVIIGISPRLAYHINQDDKIQIIFTDEIIDTIIRFVKGDFRLTDMKFLVELNGLNFNDIKHTNFTNFMGKTIRFIEIQLYCYKFKSGYYTPDEIDKIIRLMKCGI